MSKLSPTQMGALRYLKSVGASIEETISKYSTFVHLKGHSYEKILLGTFKSLRDRKLITPVGQRLGSTIGRVQAGKEIWSYTKTIRTWEVSEQGRKKLPEGY